MKKITVLIIIFILLVIGLILSLYKLTGQAIKHGKCIDSDNTSYYLKANEPSYFIKGITKYENRDKIYEDYCWRTSKVKEYYCDNANVLKSVKKGCDNGCVNGACIK